MGAVDDVHDHVRVADLLQRRPERLDELMREVAHEPDRVGDRELAAVGGAGTTHGGVEGREQRVLDEHAGAGQAVQQARLAGVGVARDRDRGHLVAVAGGALGLARGREALDLPTQPRHPGVDAAPVQLDLRLTGAAGAHALPARRLAARLARHRLAPAAQSRQQVLELRELDLGLALAALGVLAEDVEDHGRAVDDLDLHSVFERAPLARGQFGVGHDGVRPERRDDAGEFLDLAAAEVGRGVRVRSALQQAVEHDGARRLGEGGELAQGVLGLLERRAGIDADEHDVLETELPVLDLGDVLELRPETADPTQRGALLPVELLAVGVGQREGAVLLLEGGGAALEAAHGCP
ncbi:hypothetical protein GCM10025881_03710 [Pseudolysinimonas kribbensis]|uniref:Uncharacterized protein n=1 Tax=Pseudolysinimonas kribbensis TaxID=433641 RepID=A0ABQ6K0S8_9MICO|nr:hypothetical protein GCM10025881_03710 [Pseudolysinimonas kribbensis]